ncbi:MAG: polysulfide reductase NrfD [Chloroflexia bacterium]|nr:polysulfide reductase NrfD [Chloroflexia bacterium]
MGTAQGAIALVDSAPTIPVIHKPHWKWLIVAYFYLGGISGASYAIATLADLAGGAENQRIVRAGRFLAFAALMPCPPLLILDLGRPARFLNMLRTVNPKSPMSLGSWGLALFGGFAGAGAIAQAANDGWLGYGWAARWARSLPARAIGVAGTPVAFFVAGYGGVLLAATAVPLWSKNTRLLGPLFLSSAMANASAAVSLVLLTDQAADDVHAARVERLERTAAVAELGMLLGSWVRLGETARPLRRGKLGALMTYGVVGAGIVAPLALHVAGARSRRGRAMGALLTLGGGFCLRTALVLGGRVSADDPAATFAITRAEPLTNALANEAGDLG